MAVRGLVEVDSREVDGLIVIGPLQSPAPDADDAMAALTDGRPWRDKLVPADRLFAVRPALRAMNWKVLVEQFLEGYHIRTTHKDTFYPIQYDDLNVIEAFGPNTRITFPYKNIERLRDRPESTWNVGHRVTYVYHLFPNVMVATFPNQMLVITIDPIDIEHTTVTIYAMVTPELAGRVSANPDDAAGSRDLLNQGGVEDNEMSEGVQRGLHAGANEFIEFGTHESAIGRFHAHLDERLARIR
jgi:phenylpropionate dioxygenase-like ring-hydroxylating dioxygenase large terminal subunit